MHDAACTRPEAAAAPAITLYGVPECPHCADVRAWLAARGLTFTEVDVRTEGVILHQAVVHAGRPSVPVIEVGREVLIGFDAERLEVIVEQERGGLQSADHEGRRQATDHENVEPGTIR